MNKYIIITIAILALIIGGFFITANLTGNATKVDTSNLSKITLEVTIPCSGHAPLIKDALSKLNGVENIEYNPIKTFIIYYDSTKISEQDILYLPIFKDYPAKKIN